MFYKDSKDLLEKTKSAISISPDILRVEDKAQVKAKLIDELVYNLCLNESLEVKDSCCWMIWELANELGIFPASIQGLYQAKGEQKYSKITVPAVNIRGLTYNVARALIRTAIDHKSLSFVFEIAKSEIGYTFQRPAEYAAVCLAAAIKEGYQGPLFIQGDHFQLKAKNYSQDAKKEVDSLKKLIQEAIQAGFYNIDIDSSTLVDLKQDSLDKQQWNNYDVTSKLTAFIREIEPQGITVSVGGEIGEVGKKNTTPDEFRAFMSGYRSELDKLGQELTGISKISIQTGTAHGGVVLPDGTIAKVNLDFEALRTISRIAREEYAMSGAVQHGASTLPNEAFHHFPQTETAEVHLATEFQNIVYESKHFPGELRAKIYQWLKDNCAADRKEGMSEEQFIYKTRKKGFGPFKQELMDLPQATREAIAQELKDKFAFLFKKLNAANTEALVNKYVRPTRIKKSIPPALLNLL
ncbi:MAG: class II fructose-bisphosphate aldolase [Candidatus Omnitrophica bacterium]|nr:class II fructose-bisphosphate aldolase [Candidatus Omnitrophota bacterium]